MDSRVLLLKINGNIEQVLYHVIAESHGKTEEDFNGRIIITDLDLNFLTGFRIENGYLTSRYERQDNILKCESDFWFGDDLGCNQSLDEVIIVAPKRYPSITYIYSWSSWSNSDDNPNDEQNYYYGGGGGGGGSYTIYNPEPEEAAVTFEDKIDDSNLDECLKKILDELKGVNNGVGEIIAKFAGSNPGFNWKVQSGSLANANAQTSQIYNRTTGTVTSTFDSQKFATASNLSVARTIFHESVHAYIVASFGTDYLGASHTFSDFFNEFNQTKYFSRNDVDHAEFTRNYICDIAIALKELGQNQGFNLSPQFYNDLSWGGLTDWPKRDSNNNILKDSLGNTIYEETPWFKNTFPNSSDRNRINNVISIEQTGKDIYGNRAAKKGSGTGC